MKNKVSKQFLSVLLAFVMIIGLIPTSSVTVFPHIKKDAALTGGVCPKFCVNTEMRCK